MFSQCLTLLHCGQFSVYSFFVKLQYCACPHVRMNGVLDAFSCSPVGHMLQPHKSPLDRVFSAAEALFIISCIPQGSTVHKTRQQPSLVPRYPQAGPSLTSSAPRAICAGMPLPSADETAMYALQTVHARSLWDAPRQMNGSL